MMSGTTFVVLPSQSKHGVIFGINAARPDKDILEVVYVPAGESSGEIQCTYINVEAAGSTKAVILNKSSWTWGAESGANECGIAIGSVAVPSKYSDGDADVSVKRLLGVDLVRLGLERASTASEALDVITTLLEKYGQGGSSNDKSDEFHSNSFVIADGKSCFILETCGKHWVAEEITSGSRCIASIYTIGTNITKHSDGLQDFAKSNGLWNDEREFNFASAFNTNDKDQENRYLNACKALTNAVVAGEFKESNMFALLRSEELLAEAKNPTMGAQVSTLSDKRPSAHWFTATQDPRQSVFKPFMFTPNAIISKHTVCPNKNEAHTLYSLHQAAISKQDDVQSLLRSMEQNCVEELDGVIETLGDDLSEFDELLKDCVETEVKFYR